MIPRHYRLPANTRLVSAVSFATPALLMKKADNQFSYNRYGVIISKKTAKLAVERNRSKRLVRSCIEQKQASINPGHDLLFILRKNLERVDQETVCKEVITVLKNAQLLSVLK